MTYKDCIHNEICIFRKKDCAESCAQFKDKARFVELPCKVGGTIYMIVYKRAKINTPEFSFIKQSRLTWNNMRRVIADFGKTVFLTRKEAEEAEKALEKQNE